MLNPLCSYSYIYPATVYRVDDSVSEHSGGAGTPLWDRYRDMFPPVLKIKGDGRVISESW